MIYFYIFKYKGKGKEFKKNFRKKNMDTSTSLSYKKLRNGKDYSQSWGRCIAFLLTIIAIANLVIMGLFIGLAANSNGFKDSIDKILTVEQQIKDRTLETTDKLNSLANTFSQIIEEHPNTFKFLDKLFLDAEVNFNKTVAKGKRITFWNDLYKLPTKMIDTIAIIHNTTQKIEDTVDRRKFEISF